MMIGALRGIALALFIAGSSPVSLNAMESSSDAASFISVKRPVVDTRSPREIVMQRAARSGWPSSERRCLDVIVWKESRWHPQSKNRHSTARGLFQILNQKPNLPVEEQARLGFRYIEERYGSACKALSFHLAHGYY